MPSPETSAGTDWATGAERRRAVVVASDFEWDIPVDPSLLSLDPPADYLHLKPDLDGPAPAAPAEALAAGLRFYAEQMEGALPNSLDGFEPLASLQAAVFARIGMQKIKEIATLDMAAKLKFANEQFGPWFGLTKVVEDLEKKKRSIRDSCGWGCHSR